ncbi:orotidine-5'-phosphate decarboxylase [Nitriliruptoraceae bacterium ZYF776]|nr:orotidine-5'-phosphate decarboxylase [Profundirhabdus halotolerans]
MVSTDRIAVALDVPTLGEAEELAAALAGEVGWCKVGLELFTAHGPAAVAAIAQHAPVFLDLKLHDIPNTVERAAARVADLGVGLLTIHAGGGPRMVEAAVRGLGDAGRVLAVTVLTSIGDDELAAMAQPPAAEQVPNLARLAVDAGAPGLVCAAPDLLAVRDAVGPEPMLVTPGIRPAGADAGDQTRIATPASAIADGADLLVVGRPITRADDPVAAARAIAAELAAH